MCSTVWIFSYGSQSIFWRDYYDRNIDCCISGNIGRSNSYYYGNPEHAGKIGILLLAKVIIAIVAGYLVDIFFKRKLQFHIMKENSVMTVDVIIIHLNCKAGTSSYRKDILIFICIYIYFKSVY